MTSIETLTANYINGNLGDAKRQAKRFNLIRLVAGLQEQTGYSLTTAHRIAQYLKGYGSFRAAADAEANEKEKLLP